MKRLAVGRKGVGTILGAAYFIIIVLAIFNLIMWEVNQYDAYQQLVGQMNQIDQDRMSEKLEFVGQAIEDFKGSGPYSFNLTVQNLGGITTSIACIYLCNLSDTSSNALKIINKGPAAVDYFKNGFINPGESYHKIGVVTTLDMSIAVSKSQSFYIYLATERGRTFSSIYPRPTLPYEAGSVPYIDIGPLRFVFDYNSLNYTMDTRMTPQPAWIITDYVGKTPIMFAVKVINIDTGADIKLLRYCVFDCIEMLQSGASGKIYSFYIVNRYSEYPSKMYSYDEINSPQILPHANPVTKQTITNIVKFGAASWPLSTPPPPPSPMGLNFGGTGQYLFLSLMGFYYQFPHNSTKTYGVTVPFVGIRVNTPT